MGYLRPIQPLRCPILDGTSSIKGSTILNINDIIGQAGGIGAIARELGTDEGTAQSGVSALLPAVLGGFRGQVEQSPQGIGGLGGMLSSLGGGGLLDSVLSPSPSNVSAGNNVLGHIFGSQDASRAVAADASAQSGVSPSLLKKMLPLVAMLVAGYMAKHAGGGGDANSQGATAGADAGDGVGGMIGSMLGGGQQSSGSMGGLGGLASMLGIGGGGNNPLASILGGLGR